MNLSFRADLADQLAHALEVSPSIVADELLAAVTDSDLLLEREGKESAPRVNGTLANSIFSEETRLADGAIGFVGTSLSYAEPVEEGTKPHRPPIEPLELWVKQKLGVQSDKQARGIAWAIASKIAKRGTKGQHIFRNALARKEPQIQSRFDLAANHIVAQVGA